MITLNEERRAGKTTGGLLLALADAISNPGTLSIYRDHAINTHESQRRHEMQLLSMIHKLELKDIQIEIRKEYIRESYTLEIKNNRSPVYVGDDGCFYKRVI